MLLVSLFLMAGLLTNSAAAATDSCSSPVFHLAAPRGSSAGCMDDARTTESALAITGCLRRMISILEGCIVTSRSTKTRSLVGLFFLSVRHACRVLRGSDRPPCPA